MVRSLILGVGLLAGLVGTVWAQVAPAPATPQGEAAAQEELARNVRSLVRQLASDLASEREAAEQQLIRLGPKVLDLLPTIDDRTPAELRLRLQRISEALQNVAAEAAGKASVVTLSGSMRLSEALPAIEAQTGNAIIDYRRNFQQQAPDAELQLSLDKVPFWQALDQVLDQARLTVYGFPEREGVAIVNRDNTQTARGQGAVAYAGPFRIEAVGLTAQRSLRFPETSRLQLELEIAWEPRLRPIAVAVPLVDIQATGDGNQPLEIAALGELGSEITPGTFTTEVYLPFELPPRSVKQIDKLEGSFGALVPGPLEAFQFAELKAGKRESQRRAKATVTLDSVRKNNDLWEFRVILTFDEAAGALESYRGWVFNNPCYLVTKDGQKLQPDLTETVRQAENEVGIAYYFDVQQDLAGLELVYETPTVIMPLRFKYTLEKLPLP